jgi:hypothetical protein
LKEVARGKGYEHMFYKLRWIWQYVADQIESEWYVRHYDDVYIFRNALYNELSSYDSKIPLLIGHRHYSQKGHFAFPDGGTLFVVVVVVVVVVAVVCLFVVCLFVVCCLFVCFFFFF